MEYGLGQGFRADPDALRGMIGTCEDALVKVGQVVRALQVSGQTAQRWADDPVSHDVAGHYVEQLWAGGRCTYVSITKFYQELAAVTEVLRQTLADYGRVDNGAADSMERS
jgi:hypothetical protein